MYINTYIDGIHHIEYYTELHHLSGNNGKKNGGSIIKAVRHIGAIFDHSLTMIDHIHVMCRASYGHIRNIGKVGIHLTKDEAITIIHLFVALKLDYMNAFLYGFLSLTQVIKYP